MICLEMTEQEFYDVERIAADILTHEGNIVREVLKNKVDWDYAEKERELLETRRAEFFNRFYSIMLLRRPKELE